MTLCIFYSIYYTIHLTLSGIVYNFSFILYLCVLYCYTVSYFLYTIVCLEHTQNIFYCRHYLQLPTTAAHEYHTADSTLTKRPLITRTYNVSPPGEFNCNICLYNTQVKLSPLLVTAFLLLGIIRIIVS